MTAAPEADASVAASASAADKSAHVAAKHAAAYAAETKTALATPVAAKPTSVCGLYVPLYHKDRVWVHATAALRPNTSPLVGASAV